MKVLPKCILINLRMAYFYTPKTDILTQIATWSHVAEWKGNEFKTYWDGYLLNSSQN